MANIKDFAVGLVVTAPSPKTSGTTLTLRTGEGSTMPAVPFYATATPPGQLTSIGTSEKLLVTGVSGDTLTITRAQSPTTAQSIDTDWIIANAMYVDDVMKSNIVMDEALSGTVNGSNKVFTTSSAFSSIQVYKNGVTLHLTDDYTVTGTNQITFVTAPATGTKLTATYIMGSSVMIQGSNSLVTDEVPSGSVNGSNTTFTTSKAYVSGSLEVFINGVKQARTTHFTETTPTSGTFTMSDAPITGDNIIVNYQYAATVSGNADTVDGVHANTTATAGSLYPLVAKSTDANGWTVYDYGLWKEYRKQVGPLTATSVASLTSATLSSTQTMPSGTVPNGVYMSIDLRQSTTTSAVRYVPGTTIDPTASSAPANFSLLARNVTGSTLTDSDIYIQMIFRDK